MSYIEHLLAFGPQSHKNKDYHEPNGLVAFEDFR